MSTRTNAPPSELRIGFLHRIKSPVLSLSLSLAQLLLTVLLLLLMLLFLFLLLD